MRKLAVLDSQISIGSYQEFINEIFSLIKDKVPSYVCFANVHMVVEGHKDKAFQKIMNDATIVTPDGRPISLFLKYANKIDQERVCGMDVFPDLLKEANALKKCVYLYGSTKQMLQYIREKIAIEFPDLKVSGSCSPPFRELTENEKAVIIEDIKASAPDMVFVALGCPKQEKWMAENVTNIGSCLLGVGQAFNVFAGVEKRLPKWMRNLSLEWLYRLYLEPSRLWKRYLFTNSYFLFLTFNQIVRYLFNKFSHAFTKPKFSSGTLQESDE